MNFVIMMPKDIQKEFSVEDQRWMRRALDLAEKSIFLSNPNPRVGCVIVKDGRWLAEGYTQKAGSNHAEIQALNQALKNNIDVTGATAYVTLEPCSHTGRTGPCVKALIAAKIKRVVIALQDPNPKVAGQGIKQLLDAGILVQSGLFAVDSLALNPGFCARMTRGTPWVWLKTASSIDGFTALPDGSSKWITGDKARADGHYWRARACMVLTGIGTVLADNPSLNVRAIKTDRQPIRAVLDSDFIIPESAKIFNGDPVYIFTGKIDLDKAARLAKLNAQVIVLPKDVNNKLDLKALMQWLGEHEINELHVESGAKLQGALLSNDLVDEWINYIAPCVLGDGLSLANLPSPITNLEQAYRFEFIDSARFGSDMRLIMQNDHSWQSLKLACGL